MALHSLAPARHADQRVAVPLARARTSRGTAFVEVKGRGNAPTLLYIPGLGSTMDGRKALALERHAAEKGYGCIRYEPSCHQAQPRDLARLSFTDLLEDAQATLLEVARRRPVIAVGASLGSWLALLLARQASNNVTGLVLIAPAVDITQDWWELAVQQCDGQYGALPASNEATFLLPSSYAEDGAYRLSIGFLREAAAHVLMGGPQAGPCIPVSQPLRILHGFGDLEVPAERSLRLLSAVASDDAQLVIVKGGDHRLSEPTDIQLLLRLLDDVIAAAAAAGRSSRDV